MKLTAHDHAQRKTGWRMSKPEPQHYRPSAASRRPGMLDNEKYVEDLRSDMRQWDVAQKWQIGQPLVSKHRKFLREVEHG